MKLGYWSWVCLYFYFFKKQSYSERSCDLMWVWRNLCWERLCGTREILGKLISQQSITKYRWVYRWMHSLILCSLSFNRRIKRLLLLVCLFSMPASHAFCFVILTFSRLGIAGSLSSGIIRSFQEMEGYSSSKTNVARLS